MTDPRQPRLGNLVQFLQARGWHPVKRNARFQVFTPPADLDLSSGLTLPLDESAPDASEFLSRVVTTVAEIYELSQDQLATVFAAADTVFSIRLCDESTRDGSVPLLQFETFMESVKKVLVDVASFVATDDHFIDEPTDESDAYLEKCKFLQTEVGSFVTKLQLPSGQVLRDPDLFRPEPLFSDVVNARLEGVLEFVASTVLSRDPSPQLDDLEGPYKGYINLDLLQHIGDLLKRSASDHVEFQFLNREHTRRICTPELSDAKLSQFTEYVERVRSRLSDDLQIDVQGKIVELRSRNPQSNRNYVVIATVFEKSPAFVAMSLARVDYLRAIQAHRNHQQVRVVGKARRMKTQLKITELEIFDPIPEAERSK